MKGWNFLKLVRLVLTFLNKNCDSRSRKANFIRYLSRCINRDAYRDISIVIRYQSWCRHDSKDLNDAHPEVVINRANFYVCTFSFNIPENCIIIS